jgi:hypothetical protein
LQPDYCNRFVSSKLAYFSGKNHLKEELSDTDISLTFSVPCFTTRKANLREMLPPTTDNLTSVAAFYQVYLFTFMETNYLKEEVKDTDLSPTLSIPCFFSRDVQLKGKTPYSSPPDTCNLTRLATLRRFVYFSGIKIS